MLALALAIRCASAGLLPTQPGPWALLRNPVHAITAIAANGAISHGIKNSICAQEGARGHEVCNAIVTILRLAYSVTVPKLALMTPTFSPLARCPLQGCNSPVFLLVYEDRIGERCQMGHTLESHRVLRDETGFTLWGWLSQGGDDEC